jgi:hypothetical protein
VVQNQPTYNSRRSMARSKVNIATLCTADKFSMILQCFISQLEEVTGNFSLRHRLQNGSGAHPASYAMGTRGSYPGGKAAEP